MPELHTAPALSRFAAFFNWGSNSCIHYGGPFIIKGEGRKEHPQAGWEKIKNFLGTQFSINYVA